MDVRDNVQMKNQDVQPWLKIGDEEIYILNPLCRLHNSKSDHMVVWGAEGMPHDRVHRAGGIILALCNGKHTVADIARITRSLVKIADDAKATEVAKEKVKVLIYTMSQTLEERDGLPPRRGEYPTAILLFKADYDQKFGYTKLVSPEYDPRDFLPKTPAEMSPAPDFNRHETAPLQLVWLLTSDCSTNCRYCFLGRRKVKPMAKERMLSLMEEAAAIGVVEILPAGGDILLYPYLEDFLKAMCRHKFLPAEVSTKSFLSKEKAKILAELSGILLGLQFSIDSTVPDVADYLVGAKGFCDRIYRSIDNALEAGLHVAAKAVITPYNILTIPELYRDLKKRGVSTIRLPIYRRSGFHHSDDLFNHMASYKWLEKQVQQLQQEFPDDVIAIQNGPPCLESDWLKVRQKGWQGRSDCSAGRTAMIICHDGKVIPCEQMPETEEYFCGDVSHQSIQEVWNGDRMREMTYGIPREKFKGQACYDCEEREECTRQKGCCIRDLSAFEGNIYQPPVDCPKSNRSFIRIV